MADREEGTQTGLIKKFPVFPTKEALVELIRKKSYREGDFTLASGKKSTFYIDMKATTLSAEGAWLVGHLAVDVIEDFRKRNGAFSVGGVGGLTMGADPIATSVSLAAWEKGFVWPAFIVRKEPKGHGTDKYVEGTENLKKGAKVIVLEDVVTTGGSSVKAIARLRAEGYEPVAVLTIVDREEGGEAAFREQGVPLIRLCTLKEVQKVR